MRIDTRKVDRANVILAKKIAYWNTFFPQLEFDEFGRALLPNSTSTIEAEINNYYQDGIVPISVSFLKYFNLFLENENFQWKGTDGTLKSVIEGSSDFSVELFISNIAPIYDQRGRHIPMRFTRVLARVHELWDRELGYSENIRVIRTLQPTDPLKTTLKAKNSILGVHNLYLDYQKISNKQTQRALYLTINPLDFLTSSGGDGCADNPTKYYSCIGVSMLNRTDHIEVDILGEYSSAIMPLLIGNILTSALIIQPNGNRLQVPNTNYSFLGYSVRIRAWLDGVNGIYLEKSYPMADYDFSNIGLPISRPNVTRQAITQDMEGNLAFCNHSRRFSDDCYFDRVHFNESNSLVISSVV